MKALLLLALLFASNHGVLERFGYFFDTNRYLLAGLYGGIWIVSFLALCGVALLPSILGRLLWAIPITLSALLADIYYVIMRLEFNIDSAEAFWNMRFWAGDAVEVFWFRMLWPAARAVLLCLLIVLPPCLPHWSWRRALVLPAIPLLLCAGIVYGTGGYGVAGLPAQFSTLSLAGVFATYGLSVGERDTAHIVRTAQPAVSRIILVVDESIRGDFIDVRDPNGTTPHLASLGDYVVSFGIASSASNCSQASNAVLRMGANPRTLGVNGDNIMRNPTVWKYAKAAGFESTFLDAQATKGILINYMNTREKALVDRFVQVDLPILHQNDHEAAQILRGILGESQPQFVYVNKRGAHFHYERAYPHAAARFQPTAVIGSPITDRRALIHSYMNAIEWSVDGFFSILLDHLDLRDVVIIYTSDHGQNLMEDGDPVTHCRGTPSIREAMVPLLVISGNRSVLTRLRTAAERNRDLVSHFQIFPTILELMGFDPGAVRQRYYFTLFDDVPARLGFTSGAVFGRFGVPPRWTPFPGDAEACQRSLEKHERMQVTGTTRSIC